MKPAINRREFVRAMALGAASAGGLEATQGDGERPAEGEFLWVRECPRRLMVGFHVPDYDQAPAYKELQQKAGAPSILANFDAKHFVRELRKAHVQAFWFYAKCHRGNAYYPSKVGHVHSAMNGRDFFAELCEACLSEGIAPLGVYEFSDQRIPVDRPQWCHQIPPADAKHSPTAEAAAKARIGGPCLNGPYGEFVLEQTRELLANYPIKGYIIDFLGLFGLENRICPYCGPKYEKAFGRPFSGAAKMSHDEYVRYVRWWYNQNDQYAKKVRKLIRAVRPDVLFTHNFHGWGDGPWMQRMDFASENCDLVTGDLFQLRSGMLQMSWKIRGCAALSRQLPADVLLDSVTCLQTDFNTPKAFATYNAEMWTARSVNAGTTASIVMNIDGSFNRRVIELVKRVYAEHARYEPWLQDMETVANVGIVRSHDSLEFRPGARSDPDGQTAPHGQDFTGWCQALVASHCLWDLVPSHLLDDEHLRRFRAVILPSTSCMRGEECAAVRAFVQQGGTLIASGETSLFDSDGRQLEDFQLADVLGAHFADKCSPSRTHFQVGDPAFAPREAWVESMMPMLQGQLGVKAANSATVLGTVHTNASIPLVNVLLCTGEPAFLRNRFGKGQSFYFAGSIGRQYRRCGQANVLRLLRRVLDEAVGSAAPAALDGPASVELFAHWRNGQRQLVVNLVNVFAGLSRSDGSALGRSGQAGTHDMRHDEYEESPRLSEVVVRFRPHQGKMAREVYLAPDAKKLAAKVENGDTVVSVRNLSEHAMIVAEY